MPIKNAIHSQQVYDPTDESIMAEQELCMERLYAYNHTRPSEHAKREQLLKEMLAECGAGCWIVISSLWCCTLILWHCSLIRNHGGICGK